MSLMDAGSQTDPVLSRQIFYLVYLLLHPESESVGGTQPYMWWKRKCNKDRAEQPYKGTPQG